MHGSDRHDSNQGTIVVTILPDTASREHERARIAVVSRGDPLTPYLHDALQARYPLVGDLDVELGGLRRAAAGAVTFRPNRSVWGERYAKSNLAFRLRSDLASHGLRAVPGGFDAVIQTHALFGTRSSSAMIYIDCTYREAMAGWPAWTPQRGRALTRWLATETQIYRDAEHLFTFTEQGRASLINSYGMDQAKITVVGAGPNFDALPADSRHPTPDQPVVLFVGKDFERKGGDVLLNAFESVRDAVPAARLQIVGTTLPGPVPEGVDVLGLITDPAHLARLYGAASVFCLPSRFDPGGIAVLEAMAHGLPCVVSRDAAHLVPEMADTDHPTGSVVDTDDAAGLAAALTTYLQNPQFASRVGRNARQAVIDRHLWTHVVDRMAPAIDATRSCSSSRAPSGSS